MGNTHRGEVSFEAAGRKLTLRFGTNEFVLLEEALGLKGGALMVGLARNTGFKDLRTIVRAGLSRDWPGITDEQAGDVIDQLGGIAAIPELLTNAMTLAAPAPEPASGKDEAAASPSPGSVS